MADIHQRSAQDLRQYYAREEVRTRIVEFLGGGDLDQASCAYILASNGESLHSLVPRPPTELPLCLDTGCEILRSMWDRTGLLAHLDIEYVNFDFPGEVYLSPERAFRIQAPVAAATRELLSQWGIAPLHLLTGRGHHFIWQIDRQSTAFGQLAGLGRMPESVRQAYGRPHLPHCHPVDPELGLAFAGLGEVMEWVAHLVRERAAEASRVPIQLTDIEVGQLGHEARGREVVSIDLSEYADPLHTRHLRVPFSPYFKPRTNRHLVGGHVVDRLPLLYEIPLVEMSEEDGLATMRDAERTADLARRVTVGIPDQSTSTEHLLAAYRGSALARFHEAYYQEDQQPDPDTRRRYDHTPIEHLPSCTQHILQHPNDLLLKPAGIQHVVRVLLALGWHPRHIAGLIRSKFERDYDWGQLWERYDPALRADGYVRLFAGLVATGRDSLVDLNCVSNREKGYCFAPECGHNLADYATALETRRNDERLGRGTLDGLLL